MLLFPYTIGWRCSRLSGWVSVPWRRLCVWSQALTRPGWNIWLSYINNVNNRILARASADLAIAQAAEAAASPDDKVSHAGVERAEHAVEKARARRERIIGAEGGGATGVGTRMGF